jgi:hypothetical protein
MIIPYLLGRKKALCHRKGASLRDIAASRATEAVAVAQKVGATMAIKLRGPTVKLTKVAENVARVPYPTQAISNAGSVAFLARCHALAAP